MIKLMTADQIEGQMERNLNNALLWERKAGSTESAYFKAQMMAFAERSLEKAAFCEQQLNKKRGKK